MITKVSILIHMLMPFSWKGTLNPSSLRRLIKSDRNTGEILDNCYRLPGDVYGLAANGQKSQIPRPLAAIQSS